MGDLKIKLYSKKHQSKDGRTFRSFFTVAKFKEGGSVVEKTITVKFTRAVNTNDYSGGFIYVPDTEVSLPLSYEVKEEDGKKVYPVIWVRKVTKYEKTEYKAPQSRFVTDEAETTEEEFPF